MNQGMLCGNPEKPIQSECPIRFSGVYVVRPQGHERVYVPHETAASPRARPSCELLQLATCARSSFAPQLGTAPTGAATRNAYLVMWADELQRVAFWKRRRHVAKPVTRRQGSQTQPATQENIMVFPFIVTKSHTVVRACLRSVSTWLPSATVRHALKDRSCRGAQVEVKELFAAVLGHRTFTSWPDAGCGCISAPAAMLPRVGRGSTLDMSGLHVAYAAARSFAAYASDA